MPMQQNRQLQLFSIKNYLCNKKKPKTVEASFWFEISD